jgi:hypothetical protein
MKSGLWISFDLGVQGDYEGLYAWLDEHQAKECGDGLAFVDYENSGPLFETLVTELRKSLDVTKRTRIYVIYHDRETKRMKGKFIFGGRKAPPWSGFAVGTAVTDTDET